MRIGFDAKRAFFNRSGLGNYSRDLILSLLQYYPGNEYYIYTPSLTNSISFLPDDKVNIGLPSGNPGKLRQAFWRSYLLASRAKKDDIEIFHGLSNEIPKNIHGKDIKSVVTIHDLIFLRHPQWYNPADVAIYKRKFRYSSVHADRIVAISSQTKEDLISFFSIEEKKIEVIYQGCNEAFKHSLNETEKQKVKERWNLPDEFLLYVGTIEERKNLLTLVKALSNSNITFPLVVVGRRSGYYNKVREYLDKQGIKNITFLKEVPVADLPGIYQMSKVFIYPSLFEGFGIPILEALYSKVPVITSKGGCFSEAGGAFSLYIDPGNTEELGEAIIRVLNDIRLQQQMIKEGFKHALQFSNEDIAHRVMKLYNGLLNE